MLIDLNNCNDIVEFAVGQGLEVEEFEGVLLDGYIIHADRKIKVDNKTANYIAIIPQYLNEWSSQLKISFINCEKRIDNLRKKLS